MRAVGLAGWECDCRKAIFLTHSFLPCKMWKVKTCLLESQHWVAPSMAKQGCLRRVSLEACRMSRWRGKGILQWTCWPERTQGAPQVGLDEDLGPREQGVMRMTRKSWGCEAP